MSDTAAAAGAFGDKIADALQTFGITIFPVEALQLALLLLRW